MIAVLIFVAEKLLKARKQRPYRWLNKMNEKELREILQSDMKLWDSAETTEDGNAVTKVLDLPYGIGRTEVRLEGLDNGAARRSACEGFGSYIRELVNERIGDEAVTARAKQAAAKAGTDTGGVPDERGDDPARQGWEDDGGATPVPNQKAMASHDVVAFTPEGMARRADAVRELVGTYEEHLDALRLELRGITAYLETLDAPGHKKTPQDDPAA
jgi:hypothetical protein